MPTCKNCGSFVEESATECPFCSTELTKEISIPIEIDHAVDEEIIKQDESQDFVIQQKDDNNEFLLKTPEIEEIVSSETESQKIVQLDIIPERKYIYWFLIGIVTVGLGFLVYLYFNIEDLDKHSHYPNDPRGKPILVNTSQTIMLFFIAICFSFIPILWWIYYKKYASLYFHIKDQKQDISPYKLPHPILYMIPLILSHLLALVPAIYSLATSSNLVIDIPALFWSIMGLITILTAINLFLDYLWQRAFNAHNKITLAKFKINQEHAQQTP
ncbi:MAG: zinc ribbon domain-containing protein [Asgard group archaeon]|nr:zinc ribbon domain-containing protein [Asgard group archaeon]